MDFQEQAELQSEENARWDYIAILKEEHRDRCPEPEPLDMEAWRLHCAELQAKREEIPDEHRIFDEDGEEICF